MNEFPKSQASAIDALDERIAALREAIAHCEKLARAARIAITGGAVWFMLMLLPVLDFSATGFAGAMAALLGGFVLLGSNQTTQDQTEAELRSAEAQRRAAIDAMQLRVVEATPVTFH